MAAATPLACAGTSGKRTNQTIRRRGSKGRQSQQQQTKPQRPRRVVVPPPPRDENSVNGLVASAAVSAVEEVDIGRCNGAKRGRNDGSILGYDLHSDGASVSAFRSEVQRRGLIERGGQRSALIDQKSVGDTLQYGFDMSSSSLTSDDLSTMFEPLKWRRGPELPLSTSHTEGELNVQEEEKPESSTDSTESALGSFALSSTKGHASEREVESFLRAELCVPKPDLRRARQRGLYRYSVDQLRSILDVLQDFGMSKQDAVGAVDKSTVVFTLSAEDLRTRLTVLQKLGLRRNSVSRLVHTFPKVLLLTPPTLKRRAAFLIKQFDIQASDLGKIINKYSQVLCMSKNCLLKRAAYLKEEAGIHRESLARVIVVHPRILGYSWEKVVRPKIQFFTSIGLSKSQIKDLICKTPSVVSLSLEKNLKPKIDYFFKNLGGDLDLLMTYSVFLTLSLEKRIVPRHKYMLLLDHASTAERIHSFCSTDAEFARSLGAPLKHYQDFVNQQPDSV